MQNGSFVILLSAELEFKIPLRMFYGRVEETGMGYGSPMILKTTINGYISYIHHYHTNKDMRKIVILFSLLATLAYGQRFEVIRTNHTIGYIIPKERLFDIFPQDARFTPNNDDVISFEKTIRNGAQNISKRKLKKYIRQYIGVYNASNEQIIICILTHKKDHKTFSLAYEINESLDGEKYTIYYNTKTKEIIKVCRTVSP